MTAGVKIDVGRKKGKELVISYMLVLLFSSMGFLLFHKKNRCEICHDTFEKYEQLVGHSREKHHRSILKCQNCGMQFLHEKDRLHHMQEEKKRKIDFRRHR
jgi:uncharacterized protein with PIN domain